MYGLSYASKNINPLYYIPTMVENVRRRFVYTMINNVYIEQEGTHNKHESVANFMSINVHFYVLHI